MSVVGWSVTYTRVSSIRCVGEKRVHCFRLRRIIHLLRALRLKDHTAISSLQCHPMQREGESEDKDAGVTVPIESDVVGIGEKHIVSWLEHLKAIILPSFFDDASTVEIFGQTSYVWSWGEISATIDEESLCKKLCSYLRVSSIFFGWIESMKVLYVCGSASRVSRSYL